MFKKCPICGEETSSYMGNYRKDGLCKKHARMLKDGKLELTDGSYTTNKYTELPTEGFDSCVICGKATKGYAFCKDCYKEHTAEELLDILNSEDEDEDENCRTRKCILCGSETEKDYLFCRSCYKKYGDRTITVNIKNCQSFTIVDEYGNKIYKTPNGVYVRSQQELIIFKEIYNRKIRIEYEKTITFKDDDGQTKEIHPDFYLPDYELYIEHWGYESIKNSEYQQSKEYKMKVYKQRNMKVASTYSKDIDDISATIDRIFLEFNIQT